MFHSQKKSKPQDTSITNNTDHSDIEATHALKRNQLLCCSIAVCIIIVTAITLITKNFLNKTGQSSSSTLIVASQTETPSKEIDSAIWYGNYSGNQDSSYLTITKSDGQNFKFSLLVAKGNLSDKINGTAAIKDANTARYEGSDGLILNFSLNHGIVTIEKDPYCVDRHSISFAGNYINVDGNADTIKSRYFEKLRTFGSDTTYKIDINNDGNADTICYKKGVLTINKCTYKFTDSSELLDTTEFYIVDLDVEDDYLNLLFMDKGLSSGPETTVLAFTTDNKFKASSVNCDVSHLKFDYHGVIYGNFRLNILQTWYGACKWTYKNFATTFVTQKFYDPVNLYNTHPTPPSLLQPIKLYRNSDLESEQFVMNPQNVSFLETDNIHWVKVASMKDETFGWLYLENKIEIPDEHKTVEDFFSNLISSE